MGARAGASVVPAVPSWQKQTNCFDARRENHVSLAVKPSNKSSIVLILDQTQSVFLANPSSVLSNRATREVMAGKIRLMSKYLNA